jgi:hypothetical protein
MSSSLRGRRLAATSTAFRTLPARARSYRAWMIRNSSIPFGPWRTLDDIREMRSRAETPTEIGKLMDLCEEGRSGAFRVVATASGASSPAALPGPAQ